MLSRFVWLGLIALFGAGCSFYRDADDTDANVDVPQLDAAIPTDAGPPPDAAVCAACSEALECPAPGQGRATVCGSLLDLETDTPVRLADCTVCTPGAAAEGPCAVRVVAYDAAELAANPATATPLAASATYVDTCGRFRVQGIPAAASRVVALTADSDGDAYRRSATFVTVNGGARLQNARLSVLRASTDAGWTQSAGAPFGDTSVATHGVLALRFLHGSAVPGVTATAGGDPATALYFSNTIPTVRSTIDPARTTTGPNGAALVTEGGMDTYGGTGGLPANCEWQGRLAAVIPGVVTTADLRPQGAGCQ